jgi:cathepsin C
MVYDEGFNMEFDDLSFFAFSKYSIDKKSDPRNIIYNSHCFSTCVGWYHNKKQNKWGCYKAKRIDVDNEMQITNKDMKNNMNIVEPKDSIENSIIKTVFSKMHFKSIKTDIYFDNQDNDNTEKETETEKNIQINSYKNSYNNNINENKINNKNNLNPTKKTKSKFLNRINKESTSSFLEMKSQEKIQETEKSFMTLKLSSSFKNHSLYLLRLKDLNKNWEAHLSPEFSNMTIKQLNKFAGISRSSSKRKRARSTANKNEEEDLSGFPKEFDWKDYLRPAGSQGSCGSCYVYSTVRMLEARLKIKFSHEAKLSVQHPLDCMIYNQGCDGGYPFLVMKFSSEYELIPEICKPYMVNEIKYYQKILEK